MQRTYLILIAVGILILGGTQTNTIFAQTPSTQILLTWRSINYYPSDYSGKVDVTPGSRIQAGIEAIRSGTMVRSGVTEALQEFVNEVQWLKKEITSHANQLKFHPRGD